MLSVLRGREECLKAWRVLYFTLISPAGRAPTSPFSGWRPLQALDVLPSCKLSSSLSWLQSRVGWYSVCVWVSERESESVWVCWFVYIRPAWWTDILSWAPYLLVYHEHNRKYTRQCVLPLSYCSVCGIICVLECLKCHKCKKYVHIDFSRLPVYASVNFFNARSQFTCEECARLLLGEHGGRQFALVYDIINTEKDTKLE